MKHTLREQVLAHARGTHQDPLGLRLRPGTSGSIPDGVVSYRIQLSDPEFFLAKQSQFAALFEVQEIRQQVLADALSASSSQQ
jgi:hypothetical protein